MITRILTGRPYARKILITYSPNPVSTTNLLIWSGAETAVTIIATSIPFLRLVLKEVSAKFRTTQLDVDNLSGMKGSGSGTRGVGGANGRGPAGPSTSISLSATRLKKQEDEESDDGMFADVDAMSMDSKRGRVVFQGGKATVQYV